MGNPQSRSDQGGDPRAFLFLPCELGMAHWVGRDLSDLHCSLRLSLSHPASSSLVLFCFLQVTGQPQVESFLPNLAFPSLSVFCDAELVRRWEECPCFCPSLHNCEKYLSAVSKPAILWVFAIQTNTTRHLSRAFSSSPTFSINILQI